MTKQIEIPLNRLIIGFGLVFILGVLFAIVNGYYVDDNGEPLPLIVYVISERERLWFGCDLIITKPKTKL